MATCRNSAAAGKLAEVTVAEDGLGTLDPAWLRAKAGLKWSAAAEAGDGVIPCWVADMDFPAPAPVREALSGLLEGADLGYPAGDQEAALEERWAPRMAARYAWSPRPGQLRVFTDVVQAVQALLHVGTSRGDGVLLLTPSYPPLLEALGEMGRRLLAVPAVEVPEGTGAGKRWEFDLDAARHLAAGARALLLVNPHNPTGRVLERSELEVLAELAERWDLLVISDEIHADLALTGRAHTPFASLGPSLEARTVTLYSASKSFNLGGMRCAVAHLGHAGARAGLGELPSHLLGSVSMAAVAATLAAWAPAGDAWLERCLARLRANREALAAWLQGSGGAAGVRGPLPEGTYLAWLDFRQAGLGDDPARWLVGNARVMLSPGPSFGPGGPGFARLNFATAPGVLGEILARVSGTLGGRGQQPQGG
ncbi:MAG: aminotransferase class I/II-fold pyridoxal phosphate-dependent enzyme [Acidimicrobiales bacterium]